MSVFKIKRNRIYNNCSSTFLLRP